jgi:hypothetical protein
VIVRPEWLHRVVTTWTRAPEEDYFLELGDREEYIRRREEAGAGASTVENGASGSGGDGNLNGSGNALNGNSADTDVEVDEGAQGEVDDILHGFDYQAELDALMDSDTETDDGSVSGVRYTYSLHFFLGMYADISW